MHIDKITLDNTHKNLTLDFDDGYSQSLSFELLRVLAPRETLKQQKQPAALVTHKKSVLLSAIESVGRHGYRFIFDDGYSDIYSPECLRDFSLNHVALWQDYLDKMQQQHLSRESLIEIKEVK